MKILVPTKRVPDTDQKIVAAPDGSRVAVDHITFVINPFDAIALEEAVRISESLSEPVEVVAVGIGDAGYEQQLRTALAMGAARAVHLECKESLDSWNVWPKRVGGVSPAKLAGTNHSRATRRLPGA